MAANRVQSVFCRGVYLAENTSQTASVEFVPHWGTNYARSRLPKFVGKARKGFFDSLKCVRSKIPDTFFVYSVSPFAMAAMRFRLVTMPHRAFLLSTTGTKFCFRAASTTTWKSESISRAGQKSRRRMSRMR